MTKTRPSPLTMHSILLHPYQELDRTSQLPLALPIKDLITANDETIYSQWPFTAPSSHVQNANMHQPVLSPVLSSRRYVDKLLGPKPHSDYRPGNYSNGIPDNKLSFNPFTDDSGGSALWPPPSHELLCPQNGQPFKPSNHGTFIYDSEHSLSSFSPQFSVEPKPKFFLPVGLIDSDDDAGGEPILCGKNCLNHDPEIVTSTLVRDDRDPAPYTSSIGNSSSSSLSSSTSLNLSSSSSSSSSSASSIYSDDHIIYQSPKPVPPNSFVVKFNSPDTIGVSLAAVLSMKEGCLIHPDEEVLQDWRTRGKTDSIRLIVNRNGFHRRIFSIQIRCKCRYITRVKLAFEVANIMQRYLMEGRHRHAKIKNNLEFRGGISDLYLLTLRTDDGVIWRATFADRRRVKTKASQRR